MTALDAKTIGILSQETLAAIAADIANEMDDFVTSESNDFEELDRLAAILAGLYDRIRYMNDGEDRLAIRVLEDAGTHPMALLYAIEQADARDLIA